MCCSENSCRQNTPYFRNVFKENPCQHPVIILKDVSADDIVSLLSYMYQGEVFIEESKLSSFLHTAALLQVKGLTGVTQQKDSFISPTTSNKLYTQLTISAKSQFGGAHKDGKLPALKKRRSSTSDKPNDITIAEPNKKSRLLETCDIPNKSVNSVKFDNPIYVPENNIDKKCDGKVEVPVNGKSCVPNQVNAQPEHVPVTVKTERIEENNSPVTPNNANSDNDDSLPDYENSMLARSLLSGINPSKTDISANNNTVKKVSNLVENHCTRPKDLNNDSIIYTNAGTNSPLKPTAEETQVKSEKYSPKPDIDYEPEVLLSEHQDEMDSENGFSQEQSQALLLLAGMSSVPGIGGASTSQGLSHQQSNHAAICGDCPHCVIGEIKSARLRWFGHVERMGRIVRPREHTWVNYMGNVQLGVLSIAGLTKSKKTWERFKWPIGDKQLRTGKNRET
ncbi:BTB/POZ domain-containing protein [Phthorimaea operculella]|nr:BTB/POZ domain-containing protein [Phthorimaea operculella]